jgi:hypothetical protein
MASTFSLGATNMADTPPELEDAAAKMELAVMHALATFAGDAFRLGYRDHAIESMGRAVAIADKMTDDGRCDNSAALMTTAGILEADGIRAEVFARASELRGQE